MTRAFADRPLPPGMLERLVDLADRSPSAGKSQGWHVVALVGDETAAFWDATLPGDRRDGFAWPRLLDAPVVLLVLADPDAYVRRYAEHDKQASGLGGSSTAWPVPYWTVDASMAVMTLLLAAQDAGLGALFFGVFRGEAELRRRLGVPARMVTIGAVALGYPAGGPGDRVPGRSAARPRRRLDELLHRGGWG